MGGFLEWLVGVSANLELPVDSTQFERLKLSAANG